jgi:hypothetical protein
MAHDATKALLGATTSSAKEISSHDSDPASFPAGQVVSLASNGALSLLKSAGRRIGISLGKSLSDHKKTAVARSGSGVPLRLELLKAGGAIEISSYAALVSGTDDAIAVAGVSFVAQAGAATLGQATFQAATSNEATATSLAAQINAHATAGAAVVAVADGADVLLYAKSGGAAGNLIAVTYTDNDTNVGAVLSGLTDGKLSGGSDDFGDIDFVAIGAKAYINDANGKGDSSDSASTISDATYVSGVLSGVDESGALVPCALVDMPGGL